MWMSCGVVDVVWWPLMYRDVYGEGDVDEDVVIVLAANAIH